MVVRFLMASVLLITGTHTLSASDYDDFYDFIYSIKDEMPERGSNGFMAPDEEEAAQFEQAFKAIIEGDLEQARKYISDFDYNIEKFLHEEDEEEPLELIMVYETIPAERGWGTYAFNPNYTHDISIQVPHAIFDSNTPALGTRFFIESKAKWFLMAGTHRCANTDDTDEDCPDRSYPSDMSHNDSSVFQQVHRLIDTGYDYQFHGFAETRDHYSDYPDVILSNGTTWPGDIFFILQENFNENNLETGVYKLSTRNDLSRLAATNNVQGRFVRYNDDREFIHLEFARFIRDNSLLISWVMGAMHRSLDQEATSADVTEDQHREVPESIEILSNYPNPFNPATTIQYDVPSNEQVTLRVYDILGQQIATLVNETKTAGRYEVSFDASNLASGNYIYRLEVGDEVKSRTMLLVK